MFVKRLMLIFFVIFIFSCAHKEDKQQAEPVLKQIQEIGEIKPEKPPKIKLKRDAKNDYSWEISGDAADEIIKADRKLRKGIGSE
ncbi:MAG: hypothetical protein HY759_02670 [Nitrospirae bacterium]|nr:hypothetical protein [Nitrospirota bacterium]